ncbi:tpr repeat-containing protein [Pseudomonas fragi]|uniref:FAD assembly factor SdhE n=1 Tax=Pseudomonas fragi TaxID=296 RepID=A0A449IGE0_PSEFR|nr:tpr repeat-containing protein [Pseudomonas fragi]
MGSSQRMDGADQSRLFYDGSACILAFYLRSAPWSKMLKLNRLYWHSRRGMLELDVLLVPFVKEVYATLNDVDRECYRKLLECEDQDMFGCLWSAASPRTLSCSAWSG